MGDVCWPLGTSEGSRGSPAPLAGRGSPGSVRTNVVLDDDLVSEAFAVTGLRTKKELLREALKELIRARKKRDLSGLAGRIRFRDDFDHKDLRDVRLGDR